MFAFILFLATIAVFIWAWNRFSALERKLEGLERRLQQLQPKPASEAAPPRPEPAAPPPIATRPEATVVEPARPAPGVVVPRAATVTREPQETPHVKPPVIPPVPPEPPIPPRPSWEMPKFDWENIVGVRLFSWIAGIALLMAAVFFLRYSINQGWLMPPVRMAIGILVGIVLLVLCEMKAARKYPVTANAMDASAIAILFSTFFAARVLWNLIGAIPAFALMALVTAVAVLLSIRRDSVFIALLGLVGGFATPALLSTGENKPVQLFTYILLLNAGLAWVAVKKRWPLLTTLSFVFTVLYQWGWVMRFLTASQLPIALAIFLLFPVLAFVAFTLSQKGDAAQRWVSLYGQMGNLSALLPLLFALYVAAVPGYGHSYGLLFGFLFLLDAGLFAIAIARGPEILHLAGGVSTLLVWAIWLASSYRSGVWPAVLSFVVLFAFFYLAAPLIARRAGRPMKGPGAYGAYTAPFLLFVLPCLAAMEPACSNPAILFGTLFLILFGIAAYAIREEEGPVYYVAAVFALLAETVWSIQYLAPERLYSGLAVYGVFALFFIVTPMAAQRWHKRLRPEIAGMGLLLASLALLFFLTAGPVASMSLWGLALLLFMLNIGLMRQGAACKFPILSIAGMVLSWIVLGMLWAGGSLVAIKIPALIVMAAFALLVLAGNIWLQRRAPAEDASLVEFGNFLGLTGHLFLVVIAAQPSLCIPPWPLLGIMFLLNLGVGAAALFLRRDNLHRVAMVASSIIVIVWVDAAEVIPWPDVAVFSAGALTLFSLAWIYLAKRTRNDAAPFARTAAITIVFAQYAAIFAAAQRGTPYVEFLLTAHLLFLVVLLALEWYRGTFTFAVIAVFPTAMAVLLYPWRHSAAGFWPQLLLFSVPIYLVFILYPLLLGRRAGRSIAPCLAAVLASVPFFFEARLALIQAGWGQAIGILPVTQALLLAIVLVRLLKIEPAGERHLGRLALVAGAALAFVTVAIPLQLEKEWITIGWALEAAALAWLYRRIPHRGLLYFAAGLFAAVFVRLALNPFVFLYQARSSVRIWNWYLYTYLVASAAMTAGAYLFSKTKDALLERVPARIQAIACGGRSPALSAVEY